VERALELANKALPLYETQSCEDKGKLLKIMLSNCSMDGITLWPVYRKLFDMIFNRVKTEEWCASSEAIGTSLLGVLSSKRTSITD
jgi:hypothetical protein